MRLLLTGAFGNIGSHVLAELLRRKHEVRCLAARTPADERRAARFTSVTDVRWADIRDADAVADAVSGVETVLHFAAVIPPASDDDPDYARQVNVDGTANVIAACRAQPQPPRLIFASTFDVHGRTLDKPPPRRIGDPLEAIDAYSRHKIEGEALVRRSELSWFIPRFADVPIIGLRRAEPIMFEIGLDNRIEVLHPADAALAMANALETELVWGTTMFIGGGSSCQVTYREFVAGLLGAMGLRMLPDNAFSDKVYATDWLDTEESQRLLWYQRCEFDTITADIAATLGWRRHLLPLTRPFVERAMLRLSPYYANAAR
ncbi:NAD-dependent epimerase/dehydratase family protein [Nocardia australiensis]|uniref:NAD-dependent epimerase/dehydratase family protein n=1 Tax=Nocardia australiensis TaxID=2887191 RepID=UPI001D13DE30|nr:NAD(P)-dependent oxidoreductase [Nocardia australiensis]